MGVGVSPRDRARGIRLRRRGRRSAEQEQGRRSLLSEGLRTQLDPVADRDAEGIVPQNTGAHMFHFPPSELGGWKAAPKPSVRAALVLSAVGCGWWEDERHA